LNGVRQGRTPFLIYLFTRLQPQAMERQVGSRWTGICVKYGFCWWHCLLSVETRNL